LFFALYSEVICIYYSEYKNFFVSFKQNTFQKREIDKERNRKEKE